jgi:hypothetical protein
MSNIEAIQAEIANLKTRAKLLSLPVVKRLAQKYPDADFYAYSDRTVKGQINIFQSAYEMELGEGLDISELPDVQAYIDSYRLKKTLVSKVHKVNGRDVNVVVELNVEQRFTTEEKDLLRSLGKLQRQSSEYDTLVCGV